MSRIIFRVDVVRSVNLGGFSISSCFVVLIFGVRSVFSRVAVEFCFVGPVVRLVGMLADWKADGVPFGLFVLLWFGWHLSRF